MKTGIYATPAVKGLICHDHRLPTVVYVVYGAVPTLASILEHRSISLTAKRMLES